MLIQCWYAISYNVMKIKNPHNKIPNIFALYMYIWSKMLSSSLDALLKVSKTTSSPKLFDYDCLTLYHSLYILFCGRYVPFILNNKLFSFSDGDVRSTTNFTPAALLYIPRSKRNQGRRTNTTFHIVHALSF